MSCIEHTTHERKREHLNYEERKTIERMLRAGANKGEIARALYRDKSTIKREIKRGTVVQRKKNPYEGKALDYKEYIEYTAYFSDVGQRVHEQRRNNGGSKNKVAACGDLVSFVEKKILGPEKWSPDTAIGYAKVNGLFPGQEFSVKTFYNWIDDGLVKVKNMDLLLKVKRKLKTPIKVQKRCYGESIDNRPKEAENRQTFGHWEGDSIVGKGHIGQIITLVERKTRVGLMFKFDRMSAENMVTILKVLKKRYGRKWFKAIFKSITFDNGGEFAYNEAMSKYTKIYYAHAYRSCERASNENYNGIIRRFVPKGTAFTSLTNDEITRINHVINTLPRKIHGYKTALELFHIETAT